MVTSENRNFFFSTLTKLLMQSFTVAVDFNLLSYNCVTLFKLIKPQQIHLLELTGFTCCELLEGFLYKLELII